MKWLRLVCMIVVLCSTSDVYGGQNLWIEDSRITNAAGEFCCSIADCGVIDDHAVVAGPIGYVINGEVRMRSLGGWKYRIKEMVPYSEAQPSADSHFWRCQRPDGTRRCFFAPNKGS